MLDLFKVFMSDTAPEAVSKVLMSGFIGQGEQVENFEKALKRIFNNDYVLTVNSCTSALSLALHLIKPLNGFKPTDEVIVTPLTCFATITPIVHAGLTIRWADVDPKTCNIDLLDVERKLNSNTVALVVVHWGGNPVDIDQITKIKNKYQSLYNKPLNVIEDCAHCWNTKYKNKLIGNSGNYCCFSFQAIKFLTTIDGGLLIAPSSDVYDRAKLLRWFGLDRTKGASFRCVQNITEAGFKYHLHDVAATIGLENLPHVNKNIEINRENANYYNSELKNIPGLSLLDYSGEPSYWLYTLKVENRIDFINMLKSEGIASSQVHNRCDQYSGVYQFRSSLPNMDRLESRYVCIPNGWWITTEQREYIVKTIKSGW